jgi:hypothetical protein
VWPPRTFPQKQTDVQMATGGHPMITQPETAHTPLPWDFDEYEDGTSIFCANPDSKNHGEWVARVVTELTEHGEVNAAFIVRACNSHAELLAALEGLLTLNIIKTIDNLRDSVSKSAAQKVDQARAVIAKARQ